MPYHLIEDPEPLQAVIDALLAIESEPDLLGFLQRVADAACQLTGARGATLGVLDAGGNRVNEHVRAGVDTVLPGAGDELSCVHVAAGVASGQGPAGSFLTVPLRARDVVYGGLCLTGKQGGGTFTSTDEGLAVALATAAGIAVDHERLRSRVAELTLAADRERIARDLHDTVIQRLFATGLSLQSSLSLAHDPELAARIEEAVGDLDTTIRQVRATIFALEQPEGVGQSLRSRVLSICAEAARSLGFEPEVRLAGPLDNLVGEDVAVELLSSLREALSNVARHAGARWAAVEVSAEDELALRVVDDGVGPGPVAASGGQGIANMHHRARAHRGWCTVTERDGGGTEVRWVVPLRGDSEGSTG